MYHKRLYLLDTNVLMHDPHALFCFQHHDVYIPMVVLEELDQAKTGGSEIAQNVRQVSRYLDDLIGQVETITAGLPLLGGGRLFFQTQRLYGQKPSLLDSLPDHKADNLLLQLAIQLQTSDANRQVVIVSKDLNLRIKAHVLQVQVEDYHNDQVLDEAQNLTAKQMKTLVTRAGPGSKVVCLGNIAQIDTPYLSEITSGLTYVVDCFKHWEHAGHITLQRGERSRLAAFALDRL